MKIQDDNEIGTQADRQDQANRQDKDPATMSTHNPSSGSETPASGVGPDSADDGARRTARAAANTLHEVSARAEESLAEARRVTAETALEASARLETAAGRSRETIAKVKEQAAQFASQAGHTARKAADRGKVKAAEALDTAARSVEDAAGTIDDRWGDRYGAYARDAASRLTDVASSLRSTDFDAVIEDTRDFVRRNPMLAVGAAAVAGFLLTRLARSGSSDRS